MKNKLILIILTIFTTISACKTDKKSIQSTEATPDNSRTSLDWKGVYRGVLPCADCEGIQTEIALNIDLTYQITSKYLGKNEEAFKEIGTFIWDDAGAKITLKNAEPNSATNQYLVGENMLFKLDADGNRIEGELKEKYQLKKVYFDTEIAEKYWKLVELNGNKIILDKNQNTGPHLMLKNENSQVYGNGGCNAIQGSYELSAGKKIKFSKMATTKMFCDYMETEQALLNVLEMADNYSVEKDTVSLKNANMLSLAKFQLIYGK
ncbi:MAG TPA: copper resistance protein NlpE N-terminal domain-containing protein [Lutibacter sp.]|nr:copper resistance protein NlpE N-terminal domain-containing protein [Lutibacter sp.]